MTATQSAADANLVSQDYIEGPRTFAERNEAEVGEPVPAAF
jgi:hypothetical protein